MSALIDYKGSNNGGHTLGINSFSCWATAKAGDSADEASYLTLEATILA